METATVDPAVLAAQKATEATAKAAKKAEDKAAREAKKLADAEARKAEKKAAKVAREAKKQADAQAKTDAKAAAVAAKEAGKMPIQNEVRRPKPDTTCGKCWAVYDQMTNDKGSYVAIGDAKKVLEGQGVNEATIRTQYAHWRKYNGVTGRIEAEKAPEAPPPQPTA